MPDDAKHDGELRLTRRRLVVGAGAAAAATGLVTLPGCGDESTPPAATSANVNAPQLRAYPFTASQTPLNCTVFGFFSPHEAQTVDAFVARLIPGDASDPGASEACVPHYIDRKLAEFESFAAPTYQRGPFAKPAKGHAVGFEGDTVYVDENDLPRYGFQSSMSPQDAYRKGLEQLDGLATTVFGAMFVALSDSQQDDLLTGLEANDPSEAGRKKLAAAPASVKRLADAAKQAFEEPSAYGFFSMVQDDCNEGMFADPLYGGNREYAGWMLIGYPGAQRAWTPTELKQGPKHRTIQGLREMHAQHPGRPSEHAILPVQGTRRAAS